MKKDPHNKLMEEALDQIREICPELFTKTNKQSQATLMRVAQQEFLSEVKTRATKWLIAKMRKTRE